MTSSSRPGPEIAELLRIARQGDREAVGRLLEACRSYMKLLVRVQIGRLLRGKMDPSDVVQEAFLEAHRSFGRFRGTTEAELLAWLRQILASRLADTIRHYNAKRRDVRIERQLAEELKRSSEAASALAQLGSSPSKHAVRQEEAARLAAVLEELPPGYREVILLRQVEGLSFAQVAERMGRSVDSVKKLWVRGLRRLRRALGETLDGSD